MLNETKNKHRIERLKGYDYASPGYYFVTFKTKVRRENILCAIKELVGPAPLGGPFPSTAPQIIFTEAGKAVHELIQNIEHVYSNAFVDSYVIMPDHVHLLLYLSASEDGPPRGAGPTRKKTAIPQIVNALKAMTTKRIGHTVWQEGYHDHIIRNETDLQAVREYIQNNPLKWILDRTEPNGQEENFQ